MLDVSITSTNQSSVLATGMLVSVRYRIFNAMPEYLQHDQFVAWGSSFLFIALFWLMGKCMFALISDERKKH
jgi:hypothetical protein